ncbi:transmembrane protein 179B [Pogona vitticeps]
MAQLSGRLLVELALSAAAFLCGIICASALTVTQGEFGGHCILYSSVLYNGTLWLSSSSPVSLCYFVSAVSVLTSAVSFGILIHGIYNCCFGDRQPDHTWVKGSLALTAIILFFLMVSGCILRVGMDTLCNSIQKAVAATSCQEAQHRPWVQPYHAERFYDNLYTAEAAAWVNFFFWCLMAMLLFLEYFNRAPGRPFPGSGLTWNEETAPIFGEGPPKP